jgi:hypothetical protein
MTLASRRKSSRIAAEEEFNLESRDECVKFVSQRRKAYRTEIFGCTA